MIVPFLMKEAYHNRAAPYVQGYSYRGLGLGLRFMLTADYQIADRIHMGLEMRHDLAFQLLVARIVGHENPNGPNPDPSYLLPDAGRARNIQWPLLRLGFDL